MTAPLIIRVTGDPAPKGSNRAMVIGGRARFVPGGSKVNQAKLGSWKTAVTDAFEKAWPRYPESDTFGHPIPTGSPAACGLVFRLPLRRGDLDTQGRPKEKAPLCAIVKPDTDKLVRSTWDALTTAGAWGDDGQAAFLFAAKLYVQPGAALGCTIILAPIDALTLEGLGVVSNLWLSEVHGQSAQLKIAREAAAEERRRSKRRPAKAEQYDIDPWEATS